MAAGNIKTNNKKFTKKKTLAGEQQRTARGAQTTNNNKITCSPLPCVSPALQGNNSQETSFEEKKKTIWQLIYVYINNIANSTRHLAEQP